LLQWRELVRHFEPSHVFLLLYENDVNDDRDYAGKGTYSPSGDLIAVPGDAGGKLSVCYGGPTWSDLDVALSCSFSGA
jgi:hypothetical protein